MKLSPTQLDMWLARDEIIVDSFAGGGGASEGIRWALGRGPHVAINHDREAIALHAANHPESEHHAEDVWHVDPVKAVAGRKVGLMWLSPDCKHFSKAKGGKPVSKKIRGLAWTAVRWAKAVRPRVIVLENVEEFQTWGPLDPVTLRPCPVRKGKTFRSFVRRLERLGYQVQWREMRACDFGAPTIRKRLFLIARCDGCPIVWPEATHGPNRPKPWRTAAECIDWSIPCPSIFERTKPLADNTLKRIARGVQRYVVDAPNPFIVPIDNASSGGSGARTSRSPLSTVTAEARHALVTPIIAGVGGRAGQSPERPLTKPTQTITSKADAALVVPHLVSLTHHGGDRVENVADPMMTITGAHRGEKALVGAFLKPRYGEREGQAPRARSIDVPAPVIVPTGNGGDLVTAFMAQHNTDVVGHSMTEPVSTIVGKGCTQAPVTATLERVASAVFRCDACGYVNRFAAKGWEANACQSCGTIAGGSVTYDEPIEASSIVKLRGTAKDGQPVDTPLHTVSAGGQHFAEVRAFMVAYYGNEKDGGSLHDPARTVTSKERFGLVTVEGVEYAIVDIGMRMLAPRELYRAQGFPDSYRIDIEYNGKPLTKTAQVRMCGNSVCPPMAAAIVAANLLPASFAGREVAA